jgi:hypothetical protein
MLCPHPINNNNKKSKKESNFLLYPFHLGPISANTTKKNKREKKKKGTKLSRSLIIHKEELCPCHIGGIGHNPKKETPPPPPPKKKKKKKI